MDAAKVMANKIMSKAPVAVQLAKDAINRGFDMNLQAGLAYEADNFGICFATDDQKEGMKAYLEKRKPAFAGK